VQQAGPLVSVKPSEHAEMHLLFLSVLSLFVVNRLISGRITPLSNRLMMNSVLIKSMLDFVFTRF